MRSKDVDHGRLSWHWVMVGLPKFWILVWNWRSWLANHWHDLSAVSLFHIQYTPPQTARVQDKSLGFRQVALNSGKNCPSSLFVWGVPWPWCIQDITFQLLVAYFMNMFCTSYVQGIFAYSIYIETHRFDCGSKSWYPGEHTKSLAKTSVIEVNQSVVSQNFLWQPFLTAFLNPRKILKHFEMNRLMPLTSPTMTSNLLAQFHS